MKLLSFAIPCYNSADYMEKCIKSVLIGGEDVEVIIVDDGSTKDDTAEIADRYAKMYPTIVKAVHQENGGHGQAVNTGLAHATGKFFKVVDSDDWVDARSYKKILTTLKSFVEGEEPDMVIANYVYDKVGAKRKKVIHYDNVFPVEQMFGWDDIGKFKIDQYILMHSVIYRTQLLKDCALQLPKHTFYVDNIFVFEPLPYVKNMYYINTNFYRYFIGREDQSVNEEVLKKAGEILDESNWEQWHCAILIESDKAFFDNVPDNIDEELMQGLHRNFFYLNLNTRQSVLFFSDVYCDYQLVAKHLYDILKQNYSASFHLAVSSRFEGHEALPEIMSQLEQTMEEKFYHPDVHVFNNEASDSQPVNAETQDSRLMEKISEDISRKDVEQLKKHFECLVKKYENDTRFSAMYVKFVFSNVIQELFQENQFSEERKLDHEVERLYSCTNLKQILAITQENIKEYEEFLERSMSDSRDEVASVKNYIYQHYEEDLNLEMLAEKVYLSSGYLSFIFKKETGMNLNRFIRVFRMEKAKELLENTTMKNYEIAERVGFADAHYFGISFKKMTGCTPTEYAREKRK